MSSYRPRHAARRANPIFIMASLVLGIIASGAATIRSASHVAPRAGLGRFG